MAITIIIIIIIIPAGIYRLTLTVKTLKEVVNLLKVNNKDARNNVIDVVLISLCC